DERLDFGDRLAPARLDVGAAEPEGVGVLKETAGRLLRQLAAALAALRRLLVDVVVHVRDVVDERDLVPARAEPTAQPHGEHARPRVPHVDALVDGRAADVHADRPWGIRE